MVTAAGPLTGTLCSVMLVTRTLSTLFKAAMLNMSRWQSQTPGLHLAAAGLPVNCMLANTPEIACHSAAVYNRKVVQCTIVQTSCWCISQSLLIRLKNVQYFLVGVGLDA